MTASVPIVYVEPIEEPAANPAIAQADSDAQLVALWIGSHASPHTRRNYQRQADRFLAFVGRPLALLRMADLQAYLATLEGLAPATRANATAALKSLLSFAQETGYLRFNVGKVVKTPPIKNTLAARILSEAETHRMLALETDARNRALLTQAWRPRRKRSPASVRSRACASRGRPIPVPVEGEAKPPAGERPRPSLRRSGGGTITTA
jgi:integrase